MEHKILKLKEGKRRCKIFLMRLLRLKFLENDKTAEYKFAYKLVNKFD
jgi:hypothetical protein